MTAMSEAYEPMTDTAEQAMDMYDQIAEWCAVLESCAESTDHPYQHQKLTEIAEHLRRLRAPQREPVAYRYRWPEERGWRFVCDRNSLPPQVNAQLSGHDEVAVVQPLYTEPPAESEEESSK